MDAKPVAVYTSLDGGDELANANPRPSSESVDTSVEDEDCVVLDGDPFKQLAVVSDDMSGESDDIFIVAEKGQIACRDFPHPRYSCAKFSFASTPHERHCDLCHCYVCDSPAPCVHWGTGTSSIDHCHATGKEELWRLQRRNLKKGDKALTLVPKLIDNSLSGGPPEGNKVQACARPKYLSENILGRTQRSGYIIPRNKFPVVPRSMPSSHSHIIWKERKHYVGSLGRRSFFSDSTFKRMA